AERLLEFFGVPYQRQSAIDFRQHERGLAGSNASYRILCAAQTFSSVIGEPEKTFDSNGSAQQLHSVFLYSNGDPVVLANMVGQLAGTNVSVGKGAKSHVRWSIADDADGMCGVMRGLHVDPRSETLNSCNFFELNGNSVTPLIASGDHSAFLKITWQRIPVFV